MASRWMESRSESGCMIQVQVIQILPSTETHGMMRTGSSSVALVALVTLAANEIGAH